MQPYQPLKLLGPGLWIRDGEWYGTIFRRRMTVMALRTGELVIHNPFVLSDEDLSQLKSLGNVVAILMPNAFHGDEIGWMAERLPKARVFAPAAIRSKLQKKSRIDGTLENDWPSEWASDVTCLPIEGLRMIHESVFFHRASRTLVLTDLAFNMRAEDFKSSVERKIMSWNHVGMGFGPSWLCDHVFTRDISARRRTVEAMLRWDFDRVIMNHGHVVETGGKNLMKASFCSSGPADSH